MTSRSAANTQTSVNEVKIELQQLILEAQQALSAANDAQSVSASRIADLEAEVMRLKDWSADKQRYELKRFHPGSFAYMLKSGMEQGEIPHRLCAHCFQQGKKSLLQATAVTVMRDRVCHCPSCKTDLPFGVEMAVIAPLSQPPEEPPAQKPYNRLAELDEE